MSNSIKDKHICFTGKMEHGDRGDMKEQARELGAIVQSSVNSKTDILVHGADVAHNSKHTKIIAAQKHNVIILNEESYFKLIK